MKIEDYELRYKEQELMNEELKKGVEQSKNYDRLKNMVNECPCFENYKYDSFYSFTEEEQEEYIEALRQVVLSVLDLVLLKQKLNYNSLKRLNLMNKGE